MDRRGFLASSLAALAAPLAAHANGGSLTLRVPAQTPRLDRWPQTGWRKPIYPDAIIYDCPSGWMLTGMASDHALEIRVGFTALRMPPPAAYCPQPAYCMGRVLFDAPFTWDNFRALYNAVGRDVDQGFMVWFHGLHAAGRAARLIME